MCSEASSLISIRSIGGATAVKVKLSVTESHNSLAATHAYWFVPESVLLIVKKTTSSSSFYFKLLKNSSASATLIAAVLPKVPVLS